MGEAPSEKGRTGQDEVVSLTQAGAGALAALTRLKAIPEERLWLEGQQSEQTRRAYRHDVAGFMEFLGITTTDELRQVDRAAALAFRRNLEDCGRKPSTIRRKLAALSSLYGHLVERHLVPLNPFRDIRRPRIGRHSGTTAAFSPAEARKLLDAPDFITLDGLRDRAILSVGLQVGPRRREIARLTVRDLRRSAGYDCLRFQIKGGTENDVAIHPQTAQRIREYLAAAGHSQDLDGPLFRPVRPSWQARNPRRPLNPDMVDVIVKKYASRIGLTSGYSAHSMRATFITTALTNGASLEEVQRAAGHADPDTTKLYDRRGHNPERSASFFANY